MRTGAGGPDMAAVPKGGAIRYRRMTEADLERVIRIEYDAYRFGWTLGIFQDCLRVGYHCLVQEIDGEIVGYAIVSSAAGEAHLLNLCIAPAHQRRGLARHLLAQVLDLARHTGADDIFLEVRPTNQTARRLYEAAEFVEVSRRRGYYPAEQGREDALVMARSLRQVDL